MSRNGAAEYLGVKTATLSSWAATGRHSLPFTRVGGRVLYSRSDLDRWMAERTGTSAAAIKAGEATRLEKSISRGRSGRA